ncbi:hypothetical protein K9L27_01115 [Candidatus Gracilibacteria bacterium]|nr:hypothetical protein [Candidatus Gracilibacteria bacterium]
MSKNFASHFRLFVALIALGLLVVGSGYIIWSQRPIMKIANDTSGATASSEIAPLTSAVSYSMDDIAIHNTKDNCWSSVNGEVYDLTSFVYRHPGGAASIIKICGMDGSDLFSRQHGKSRKASAALILLKIGELKS